MMTIAVVLMVLVVIYGVISRRRATPKPSGLGSLPGPEGSPLFPRDRYRSKGGLL